MLDNFLTKYIIYYVEITNKGNDYITFPLIYEKKRGTNYE